MNAETIKAIDSKLLAIECKDASKGKTSKFAMNKLKTVLENSDVDVTEKLNQVVAMYEKQIAMNTKLLINTTELQRGKQETQKTADKYGKDLALSFAKREKLQALCQELQRQNQELLTEAKRIAGSETQERKDLSEKFKTSIQDINGKLEIHEKDRVATMEENLELHGKLKDFYEQYKLREEQYEHQLKTKTLEVQLAEAKLQQQVQLLNEELTKRLESAKLIDMFKKREDELRSQVNMYSEKFDEFQKSLNLREDVFSNFKKELNKKSNKIVDLEKKNVKMDMAFINSLKEKEQLNDNISLLSKKNDKLTSLCKLLQSERKKEASSSTPSTETVETSSSANK